MGLFLAMVYSITRTRGIGVTNFFEFSFLVASFFLFLANFFEFSFLVASFFLFLANFFEFSFFLASFFLLFLFVLKSRHFGILDSNSIISTYQKIDDFLILTNRRVVHRRHSFMITD